MPTPLKANREPESIVKDFGTAARDFTRQFKHNDDKTPKDNKNEFKLFLKRIAFILSSNGAKILDNELELNDENTIKVQLKREQSDTQSEIDDEIDCYVSP
ncbi:MAG: hypothetical protein GY821_14725 [Gammaproteobacteria bacterium]|nr:hypothetical protein [Gammaproteobacteria bacterium]